MPLEGVLGSPQVLSDRSAKTSVFRRRRRIGGRADRAAGVEPCGWKREGKTASGNPTERTKGKSMFRHPDEGDAAAAHDCGWQWWSIGNEGAAARPVRRWPGDAGQDEVEDEVKEEVEQEVEEDRDARERQHDELNKKMWNGPREEAAAPRLTKRSASQRATKARGERPRREGDAWTTSRPRKRHADSLSRRVQELDEQVPNPCHCLCALACHECRVIAAVEAVSCSAVTARVESSVASVRVTVRTWIRAAMLAFAPLAIGLAAADAPAAACAAHSAPPQPPIVEPVDILGPVAPSVLRFGETMAADGELLAIGAPTDGDAALDPGEVAIFRIMRDARGMAVARLEQTLASQAMTPGDHFGCALAISGGSRTWLAVGADRASTDGSTGGSSTTMCGAVEVFERISGPSARWVHASRLSPRDADPGASFGAAIAFDRLGSALLAVGAPRTDIVGAFDAGRVHIFRAAGLPEATKGRVQSDNATAPAWNSVAIIDPPTPTLSGWFGASIAVEGDLLAVGSPGDDVMTAGRSEFVHGAGSVYLYRRVDGDSTRERYSLERVLRAPTPEQSAWFGLSIDLDNGTLAVSSPRARELTNEGRATGCVYLFDLATPAAAPRRIDVPRETSTTGFGQSLSLRDGVLVIGAPSTDIAPTREEPTVVEDAGAAWIYSVQERAFTARLRVPEPLPSSLFGGSSAICVLPPGVPHPRSLGTAPAAAIAPSQPRATAPTLVVAVGHLYAEEESIAPSPGAALYLVVDPPASARLSTERPLVGSVIRDRSAPP